MIQPDGKIIIGGGFSSYNGTAINRIARLNADGSLDTGFNPGTGANTTIRTTQIQADGKIIIGGDFNQYNGTGINRIARLNADGSLDTGFNPGTGASGRVLTLAVQADGKILMGGIFTSYNGTARNNIARLNADGSLDTGFNPGTGANSSIFTTQIQPDGKIIIGGFFTSYNGTARNYIARLNADGSLDSGFNPGAGTNIGIETMALQADGKILIGGEFTQYNGVDRIGIARLNADGSLDASFNSGLEINSVVVTLAVQPDGKILIGGGFGSYNGVPRSSIARLNSDGSLDTSFNPGTGSNNGVPTLAVQADGKVMIGGEFTQYNGVDRIRIARLNADGSLDMDFNPGMGPNSTVYTLAPQADKKILIGGFFTSYNGTERNRIARLNADGSLDTGFNPGTGANGSIWTTAIQPDGKIIIGGDFTGYDGVSRVRINRIQNTVGPAPDTQAPVADVENLLPFEAQCLVNFADLSIPTATDNVDGTLQGTTDESIFPITTQGSTTITWTYTDAAGNTTTQTQEILIADTLLPVITANGDQSLPTVEGTCSSLFVASASATDNCTVGEPTGIRSDGLALTEPYPVGVTTITWTVSDANGNAAAPVIQTITVNDTEAPVITTNGNQTVSADAAMQCRGSCFRFRHRQLCRRRTDRNQKRRLGPDRTLSCGRHHHHLERQRCQRQCRCACHPDHHGQRYRSPCDHDQRQPDGFR
jgi:uncharacterized delta-60 repeat protein